MRLLIKELQILLLTPRFVKDVGDGLSLVEGFHVLQLHLLRVASELVEVEGGTHLGQGDVDFFVDLHHAHLTLELLVLQRTASSHFDRGGVRVVVLNRVGWHREASRVVDYHLVTVSGRFELLLIAFESPNHTVSSQRAVRSLREHVRSREVNELV